MDENQTQNQVLLLGDLTIRLAQVNRAILYDKNRFENDAEHSFHLALTATELASSHYPDLDVGLVSQFSIVHDLAEVYAGDVPTFGISKADEAKKKQTEKMAVDRLLAELPAHTASLLERYERQIEPEARFVKIVDKLLPAVIHTVRNEQNKDYFFTNFNITSVEDIKQENQRLIVKLQKEFPEFSVISLLREQISITARDKFFPASDEPAVTEITHVGNINR